MSHAVCSYAGAVHTAIVLNFALHAAVFIPIHVWWKVEANVQSCVVGRINMYLTL